MYLLQLIHIEWTVYRNNLKSDKTKKERAEKSASSAKGKAKETAVDSASASVSLPTTNANSKAKGKEKASTSASTSGAMLPPPFTSVPRPISIPVSTDVEQPPANAAAFWRAEEDVEDEEMDAEDEFGAVDEDDNEDVDIDDEAEVGEEVQDMMAVEEEELRNDAMVLEEKGLAD
jgi:DNA polymerase epsilon subunit 3